MAVSGLEADLYAVFEASQDSNADDEHDPEGSTIAYERAQLIKGTVPRPIVELMLRPSPQL